MSVFEVSGSITSTIGRPLTKLLVQAMDNDQGRLEDRNDDLLGSTWIKNDGTFKIKFDEKQYGERFNFLREGKPDIYLVIRNELGEIIHTTPVRYGVNPSQKKRLVFDIQLSSKGLEKKVKPKSDPYEDTLNRRISAFQNFGTRADFTEDLQRTFGLLTTTLNAWLGYNNELSWRVVKYDGPIVKRYPWRAPHSHNVRWKK